MCNVTCNGRNNVIWNSDLISEALWFDNEYDSDIICDSALNLYVRYCNIATVIAVWITLLVSFCNVIQVEN